MVDPLGASATILVGGKSARMGCPKATLRIGRITMLDRTVAELAPYFEDIVVVAAPESAEQFPVRCNGVHIIRDTTAFAGPAPALSAGLRAIRNDVSFVCSCDLPMLRAGLVQRLLAMLDDYDAVVPEIDGKLQPLCAVYQKRCAARLAESISHGKRRLSEMVSLLNLRRVRADELASFGYPPECLFNVNTPADYRKALRMLEQRENR